jgi:hypothetical protein
MVDHLLKVVRECIGKKRDEGSNVVIRIDLGKVSTKTNLSSHESFQSFLVQKVRIMIRLRCLVMFRYYANPQATNM